MEIRFQIFPSYQSQRAARQWLPTEKALSQASVNAHTPQSREIQMTTKQRTIVVRGASQGIGAALANLCLDRGYNVVGNSRNISRKNELQRSDKLALQLGHW
jgi:hypothetical protein